MIIFLSVRRIAELAERLRTAYPAATPVAVVYKASWPEEKIVTGTLLDIAEKVLRKNLADKEAQMGMIDRMLDEVLTPNKN